MKYLSTGTQSNPKHVTSDIIQIIWIVSPLPCKVIRIQIDIWIVSVVSILWILIPVTHLDCGTHVLWFVSVLTVWILSPSRMWDTENVSQLTLRMPVATILVAESFLLSDKLTLRIQFATKVVAE